MFNPKTYGIQYRIAAQLIPVLKKKDSVARVREGTKLTKRPLLLAEVSAKFCGWRVPRGQREADSCTAN
jgi:hypothetical protein